MLDISVNVSGRQLDDDAIIDSIREALAVSGLDGRSLIIEVAETVLMNNVPAVARRLQAIKDLGVRIAVDDFGTGYSSLAYLRQFPVDCIKIDREFTQGDQHVTRIEGAHRHARPTRQGSRAQHARRGRRDHR